MPASFPSRVIPPSSASPSAGPVETASQGSNFSLESTLCTGIEQDLSGTPIPAREERQMELGRPLRSLAQKTIHHCPAGRTAPFSNLLAYPPEIFSLTRGPTKQFTLTAGDYLTKWRCCNLGSSEADRALRGGDSHFSGTMTE